MNTYLETVKDWKKPFFTIWAGQAFSIFGSSIVQFAFVWYLTETTGSALVLAISSAVGILPEVILGPFIGAYVDRVDRKKVMIFADLFIMLVTLVIAVLFWIGNIQLWHIFVALFLRSLGNAFHMPAVMATTSLMVPEEQLSKIQGLNQTLYGSLQLVSPPLGAFLMSVLDMHFIISIDVITAIIAISFLVFVFVPRPEGNMNAETITPKSLAKDVATSFNFIVSWRGMFLIMLLSILLNVIINPVFVLLPLLVTDHFNGDAMHLGGIESINGLGVIIGGLLMSIWGGFRKRIYTAMIGTIGMGIALGLVGFLTPEMFTVALVCFFFAGFMNTIQNASFFGVVMAKIPNEIQGKVFASFQSVNRFFLPIVYLFAGGIAEFIGLQAMYIIAGVSTVIGAATLLFFPAVRNIEETKVQNNFSSDMKEIPKVDPHLASGIE